MSIKIQSNCQENEAEIILFIAKKFITMDESHPEVKCIAVDKAKGIILSVGSLESMKPWVQGRKYFINDKFKANIVYPGFIDNHLHPVLASTLLPMDFICPDAWQVARGFYKGVRTSEDFDTTLKEYITKFDKKYGEVYCAWGFNQDYHGKLNKQRLDKIESNIPVLIFHRSAHEIFLNTKAIEYFKCEKLEGEGVSIEKGTFSESGMRALLPFIIPYVMQPKWIEDGMEELATMIHKGGITTTIDMAFGVTGNIKQELAIQHKIREGNKHNHYRLYNVPEFFGCGLFVNDGKPTYDPELVYKGYLQTVKEFEANPVKNFYLTNAIKFIVDGGFISSLMQMDEPGYIDGHEGLWITNIKYVPKAVELFTKHKIQIHAHINGDFTAKEMIKIMNEALDKYPYGDHRFTFHHLGYHASYQTRAIAKMNACVSANPYYTYLVGDVFDNVLGVDRNDNLSRLNSLVKHKVPVSLHSDLTIAPSNPLLLAWCSVNRQSINGKTFNDNEKLSCYDAMRAITIDAAYAVKLEDKIGSLSAGKMADFTILDRDPQNTNPKEIKNIKVLGTVFEGKIKMLEGIKRTSFIKRIAGKLVSNKKRAEDAIAALHLTGMKPHRHHKANEFKMEGDTCTLSMVIGHYLFKKQK